MDSARDALVALAQVGVCFCTQHGKQQRILFAAAAAAAMGRSWQHLRSFNACCVVEQCACLEGEVRKRRKQTSTTGGCSCF
jgi:hypothetical protein